MGNTSGRTFSWGGGSRVYPGETVRNERVKFREKPKAWANQGVKNMQAEIVGRFDFRGGQNNWET